MGNEINHVSLYKSLLSFFREKERNNKKYKIQKIICNHFNLTRDQNVGLKLQEFVGRNRHSNRHTPENALKCKLRSKFWWLTKICNSHDVSHFAAFFIVVGAKTSVAESVYKLLIYTTQSIMKWNVLFVWFINQICFIELKH